MTLTSDTLRGVADMLDALSQLDTDAGREPLGNDVTYSAGGAALHLAHMPDWRPRAETIMEELGGTWGQTILDTFTSLASRPGRRDRWVEAGNVHLYVPRWEGNVVAPLADLSGLPGLVLG